MEQLESNLTRYLMKYILISNVVLIMVILRIKTQLILKKWALVDTYPLKTLKKRNTIYGINHFKKTFLAMI